MVELSAQDQLLSQAHAIAEELSQQVGSDVMLRSVIGQLIGILQERTMNGDSDIELIAQEIYQHIFGTKNLSLDPDIFVVGENGECVVAIPSRVMYMEGKKKDGKHTCTNATVMVEGGRMEWAWDQSLSTLVPIAPMRKTVNNVRESMVLHTAIPGMIITVWKGTKNKIPGRDMYAHDWNSVRSFRVVEAVDPDGVIEMVLEQDMDFLPSSVPIPRHLISFDD